MIFGVDCSHYQPNFDFGRARREGIEFAILKATEGASHVDDRFSRHVGAARDAGMLYAAYHYQRSGDSAAAQAANITRVVPKDCPVILDVEDGGGNVGLTRDITNRLNGAGWHTPLLYLPSWYWQQIGKPDLRGLPPLWYSRYPSNATGAPGDAFNRNASWLNTMWAGYGGLGVEVLQFTDKGSVAGLAVDCNAFRGTRDQLSALLGGGGYSVFAAVVPGGIESMAMDTQWTDSYGNTQTVQSFMADLQRKVNDLWFPAVSPGSVQSRIPGDANVTNIYDMVADNTSWTNQILGRVIAVQAASGGQAADPKAVADALRPVVADVVGPVIKESVTAALGADNQGQADAIVSQIAQRLGTGNEQGANHG